MILSGRLHLGDRLLPERELAEQFGMSRTVVRQAIHALSAKGLLETLLGGGTTVRSPSAAAVARSVRLYLRSDNGQRDYGKVHEIRSLLEVEIAGLAAHSSKFEMTMSTARGGPCANTWANSKRRSDARYS